MFLDEIGKRKILSELKRSQDKKKISDKEIAQDLRLADSRPIQKWRNGKAFPKNFGLSTYTYAKRCGMSDKQLEEIVLNEVRNSIDRACK